MGDDGGEEEAYRRFVTRTVLILLFETHQGVVDGRENPQEDVEQIIQVCMLGKKLVRGKRISLVKTIYHVKDFSVHKRHRPGR